MAQFRILQRIDSGYAGMTRWSTTDTSATGSGFADVAADVV
jgi:hypothetical protein